MPELRSARNAVNGAMTRGLRAAMEAIDAHEHGGPFGHGAEGGADRFRDGGAEDVGFDAGERGAAHSAAC